MTEEIANLETRLLKIYPNSKPLLDRIKAVESGRLIIRYRPDGVVITDSDDPYNCHTFNISLRDDARSVWVLSRNGTSGFSKIFGEDELNRESGGKPFFEALADLYKAWFKKPTGTKKPATRTTTSKPAEYPTPDKLAEYPLSLSEIIRRLPQRHSLSLSEIIQQMYFK